MTQRIPVDQAMQLAISHHQGGRLREAEDIYRKILAANPNHFQALQLLGALARQTGHRAAAIDLISRALKIDPNAAGIWTNLAFAHYEAAQYDQALAAADRAIALSQNLAAAYIARGATLVSLGRHAEAVTTWNRLIAIDPNNAEAHSNLGATLEMMGQIDAALIACERAVALKPEYAGGRVNLGSVLLKLGRSAQAAEEQRRAIRLQPDLAAAYINLANAAQHLGQLDEAASAARRALELSPNDVNANLTAALQEHDDLDRATSCFANAIRLLDAQAKQQPPSAAAESKQFAARLRLASAVLLPPVYESKDDIARWRSRLRDGLTRLQREGLKVRVDLEAAPTLFGVAYQGEDDIEITRTFASLIAAPQPPTRTPAPLAGRKLRVGFISRFFNNHTIGRLNMGLIATLSRDEFEVIVLFAGGVEDEFGSIIRRHADRFYQLPQVLPAMREFIAKLDLDVLFYTDLGMDPLTYSLAFTRLAPVQCVTWGHPVTSGIDTIDYFISSELLEPPGSQSQYTERLVRLPSLAVHYQRPILTDAPKSRADFNLPADATIYGCPQMLWKFHPDFDYALAGVLRRDPLGRVIIIEGLSAAWQRKLIARFRRVMPDVADRILFLPRLPYDDFLNLVSLCDVSLDPYPFGGGNTTLEALALGVPVVTLPTNFLRGRITKALYEMMSFPELVARDADHYIELAVRLGTDVEYRKAIGDRITAASQALYENPTGVRALERFLIDAVAKSRPEPGASASA